VPDDNNNGVYPGKKKALLLTFRGKIEEAKRGWTLEKIATTLSMLTFGNTDRYIVSVYISL